MAQSQNTVREIFVVDALASETTMADFKASASDGEIAILQADGSAGANASEDFIIVAKLGGKLVTSDVYNADQIKRAVAVKGQPQILKNVVVKPTDLTSGVEYVLNLRITEFGSLSVEDFYMKHGQYIVQAGDTAASVVDGLISSLNKNFSREPGATAASNPYFSFNKGFTEGVLTVNTAPDTDGNAVVTISGTDITVALLGVDTASGAATKIASAIDALSGFSAAAVGADVTITSATDADAQFSVSYAGGATNSVASYVGTAANAVLGVEEKSQPVELGKKEGRPLSFSVMVDKVGSASIADVTLAKGGFPGVGTGKQVAVMEYFYRGNRGDAYRNQHFPYNWPLTTKSQANVGTQYSLIEMTAIRKQDEEFNTSNSRKQVTIAVPSDNDSFTAINAVINQLENVINQTIADLA